MYYNNITKTNEILIKILVNQNNRIENNEEISEKKELVKQKRYNIQEHDTITNMTYIFTKEHFVCLANIERYEQQEKHTRSISAYIVG